MCMSTIITYRSCNFRRFLQKTTNKIRKWFCAHGTWVATGSAGHVDRAETAVVFTSHRRSAFRYQVSWCQWYHTAWWQITGYQVLAKAVAPRIIRSENNYSYHQVDQVGDVWHGSWSRRFFLFRSCPVVQVSLCYYVCVFFTLTIHLHLALIHYQVIMFLFSILVLFVHVLYIYIPGRPAVDYHCSYDVYKTHAICCVRALFAGVTTVVVD